MKPTQPSEFSWPMLFFVTAGSFFIFALVLKMISASDSHVAFFFKIGLGATGLGVLATIGKIFTILRSEND